MKKIAVFTSGGDAPGMNACIRAVVRAGIHKELEVVGIKYGYNGMIDGDFISMNRNSVSNIIQTGGTILHSARSMAFHTKEGRAKAIAQLKKHNIDGVVAIGGDGTFTGANVLKDECDIPFIGIPGTIDNDLYGTDFTIGYDTAINTAMEAIDKIKDTASSHNRLFFVEVMGRDAGFIALRSGLATGAEAILVPESKTEISDLVKMLEEQHAYKKSSGIVIVAEGDDEGGAFEIAKKVKEKMDSFEVKVTILGHVQRGGRPTCMERVRASIMGVAAVDALIDGRKNEMVGIIHRDICFTSFEKAIKHNQELNPLLLEMIDMLL